MRIKHLTPSDYRVSRWSGGTTTQLCIAPEGADYTHRDFLWRVSSATVELESSDFTMLPDYHRWITTLEGSITLTHEGGAPISLSPFDVHSFDGGVHTQSLGRCTDFNLMLRKGMCNGSVRPLHFAGSGTMEVGSPDPKSTMLLYCASGSGTLTAEGSIISCKQGESLLIGDAAQVALVLTADGPSDFLLAEMREKS